MKNKDQLAWEFERMTQGNTESLLKGFNAGFEARNKEVEMLNNKINELQELINRFKEELELVRRKPE